LPPPGRFLALRGRRRLGAALAALAGAGLYDEITQRHLADAQAARPPQDDAERSSPSPATATRSAPSSSSPTTTRRSPGCLPPRAAALHRRALPAVIEANDTAAPLWLPALLAPW